LSWLDGLSTAEFIVVIIVVVQVLIVVFGLLGLVFLRRKAINSEERYEQARRRLSELIPELESGNNAAKSEANRLLRRLGPDNSRRLLTELAEYMTIESATPLAELFIAAGLAEASKSLVTKRAWERLRAIREARALNDPSDMLASLVKDGLPDVRIAAFEALCALGRAEEALVALRPISQEGRLVRTRAIDSLAATEPLPLRQLANLSESDDPQIRYICIGALGRSGRREAIDVIISGVTDADVEVRIESLRALKEMDDTSALPACLSALKDEFWEVRSAAVGTCAELGGEGAAGDIAKLLADPAEWVRHNAAVALGRCGATGLAYLRQAAAEGNENASSALAAHRLTTEGG